MLIVFTGNGKGKTTATLGQAARMIGRGKKVLMIQFIKGPWKSGEDFVAMQNREGSGKFELRKMGLGFVGILGDKLPRVDHEKAAEDALASFEIELAKDPKADGWDMIILDEINVAANLKLISEERVLEVADKIPKDRFVIFSGRSAPQSFIDKAHLATEMREIKHPFNDGEMAQILLEF